MFTPADLEPLSALLTQMEYARDGEHARELLAELCAAVEALGAKVEPAVVCGHLPVHR